MSNATAAVWIAGMFLLWALLIWGVTAYAVFWLDRSGWWFLLALLMTAGGASVSERSR